MRKLFLGFAVGAMALVGAQTSSAGVLTGATFSISIGGLPGATFTNVIGTAAGAGTATGTGAGATWSIKPGFVPGGQTTATIPLTSAPPISQIAIIIAGNDTTGNFAGSSGGPLQVNGNSNVIAFGGITLLGIPIIVGVPLTTTPPSAYGIAITAFATSWTTKSTALGLLETTANGATTSKRTGTNMLVGGAGTVTLVSSLNVLTNIAGQLPSFVSLTLSYVPEPGTLLLVASGVIGLGILGRKKIRK